MTTYPGNPLRPGGFAGCPGVATWCEQMVWDCASQGADVSEGELQNGQWKSHNLNRFDMFQHLSSAFWMLRALRSLDEKDGDVLVFESAGGTSQFRRFVAAKSSWNEVGCGGSLSHDGDVVICCGCHAPSALCQLVPWLCWCMCRQPQCIVATWSSCHRLKSYRCWVWMRQCSRRPIQRRSQNESWIDKW